MNREAGEVARLRIMAGRPRNLPLDTYSTVPYSTFLWILAELNRFRRTWSFTSSM